MLFIGSMDSMNQVNNCYFAASSQSLTFRTRKTPKCCDNGTQKHPNCLPIEIPNGVGVTNSHIISSYKNALQDHFFKQHNRRCMNFVRSEAGLRKNCRLGPREQFNEVSSVLDAGTVYSNDPELLEQLRFASLQKYYSDFYGFLLFKST